MRSLADLWLISPLACCSWLSFQQIGYLSPSLQVTGLSVPYNIVALVGVWRAADRYEGDQALADLLRIVTLVGMILLTVT